MTKAISLDNLAQFKAKCDETYAKVGEGGITLSQVIAREETLPAATADSPDFVQTPDGTLYRKKAVEGGSLLGTWVFNDTISSLAGSWSTVEFNVSFTSNNVQFTRMAHAGPDNALQYYDGTRYTSAYNFLNNTWNDSAYKTIQITDISSLTNEEEFTSWLTANATKQDGVGGASVSYEYVAQQEVPTPTTADNGKVLGVANGAYALQEAGGGDAQKKLYTHYYHILSGDNAFYPVFIFDFAELFTNLADLISYLYNKYGSIVACYINGSANIGGDTSYHINEIYAQQSNSLRIELVGSREQYIVGTAGASLVKANCKVYEL